jgi:hypothetical protein
MEFNNMFTSRAQRYSLGMEADSGHHYLAIPMSNQLVDYMERYKLSGDEYQAFRRDPSLAADFAESCRRREHDERLFMQPGSDRGVPR